VTQAQIDQTCERMRDHHPYYEVDSPFGGTVAPVHMTHELTRLLFSQTYSVRGLFYQWSLENIQPVKPNVRYTVSARVSEKWIKNEREFVAYESVCKDDQDNVVFTTRRAHVLDYIKRTAPKSGAGGLDSADARSPIGKTAMQHQLIHSRGPDMDSDDTAAGTGRIDILPLANARTEVGSPLPSFSINFSRREFNRRVEAFQRSLHSDAEAARQEGLPAPVADGRDVVALAHRSAMHFFGAGWVKGGKADLTLRRPTFQGEYVASKCFVKHRELLPEGLVRLICSVSVENQTGEAKVVGTVSGLVPA
jgi:acyl dehydratase